LQKRIFWKSAFLRLLVMRKKPTMTPLWNAWTREARRSGFFHEGTHRFHLRCCREKHKCEYGSTADELPRGLPKKWFSDLLSCQACRDIPRLTTCAANYPKVNSQLGETSRGFFQIHRPYQTVRNPRSTPLKGRLLGHNFRDHNSPRSRTEFRTVGNNLRAVTALVRCKRA
jgi:hypothetical protein